MTVLKYSICSVGPPVNQDVLSAHGGPGSQPSLPRGSHIMLQQPPMTGPPPPPPPTSTQNHLASQLMGMNISGQPQPSIQSPVSKLYLYKYFLFSHRCTHMCILFVSSVSLFLSFIGK